MQIVTGIEVNSEAYFPKLREYCPSAEGTRAICPQLREIRLTIDLDDDSHYLFCYTSNRNGDGINLIVVLFYISLFTQQQH